MTTPVTTQRIKNKKRPFVTIGFPGGLSGPIAASGGWVRLALVVENVEPDHRGDWNLPVLQQHGHHRYHDDVDEVHLRLWDAHQRRRGDCLALHAQHHRELLERSRGATAARISKPGRMSNRLPGRDRGSPFLPSHPWEIQSAACETAP